MKILVPLADGFEEIEAVTIVDTLRRGGVETVTASLRSQVVTGSHKIPVTADTTLREEDEYTGIVLPGGMPGSSNLKKDPRVIRIIQKIYGAGGIAAAICAAPIALEAAGVLDGKQYTCYPGYEDEIKAGKFTPEPVIADNRIITGRGAACAIPFSLKIIELLKGKETADKLKEQMMAFW